MKKYPSYKDSGVEWIGEIPGSWEISKYKFHCYILSGFPFKSDLFSNESGFPLIRIRDITSGQIETYYTGDYQSEYVVEKGDLIIGMDGEFNVRYWDNIDGLLNQRCCSIKNFETLSRRYIYYLLPFQLKIINDLTYYTTVKHLSSNDIYNSVIPLPPLSEQHQIVSYLDEKTSQIDTLIQTKKRKIGLLKEKRTSLINEVVTKGLNPDVEMKDSGVEWIGEIPSHWESVKIKYLGSVKSGDGLKSSLIEKKGEFPVYGGNGIMGYYSEFNFEEEILIIGRVGEKCGNVHFENNKVWVNDNSLVFNPYTNKNSIQYLFYSFKTRDLNKLSSKNTQPLITGTSVKDEKIPLPSLTEQKEIVDYIDSETQTIDKTVNLEKVKIDLLKEYKQSLISEVVTGKVNVQEEVNEVLV